MKVTQSTASLQPHALYNPWNSPGQNIGVGSCSLLQVIFSTQGSKPGLPHRKQILYQLSHQGSPVCRVQFSLSVVSDSLRPHGLQYARPPCLSPTPGVYSNSCPLSQGCHPTSHPLRISCKMLSWMKHKLESRLPGEMLSNLRYVDDTILTAESEED